MKKLIYTSILLLGLVGITKAQADRVIYFNPKVGLNFSGLNDEPEGVSTQNKFGYNAGIDLRVGDGIVFLQPGIFYYQYNREYSVVNTGTVSSTVSKVIKVESIRVPVQLGFRLLTSDALSVRFNLGSAFSFPVTVTQDNDGFDINRESHKNASVGGVVGGGVDFGLLTLDLNYEFGLSDFIDFSGQNITSGSSKQYVVMFTVGLRL